MEIWEEHRAGSAPRQLRLSLTTAQETIATGLFEHMWSAGDFTRYRDFLRVLPMGPTAAKNAVEDLVLLKLARVDEGFVMLTLAGWSLFAAGAFILKYFRLWMARLWRDLKVTGQEDADVRRYSCTDMMETLEVGPSVCRRVALLQHAESLAGLPSVIALLEGF